MDPFIGTIIMFAGNFAPRGWALCDGQLLSITSNQALFSILGTTYGGDGHTTFGLPDLRGRVPVHPGHGPGLSTYRLGQKGGREEVTLTISELPSHSHSIHLKASDQAGNSPDPTGRYFANTAAFDNEYANSYNVSMGTNQTGNTGNNLPFNNLQPFISVNFIIALQGLYPSRS